MLLIKMSPRKSTPKATPKVKSTPKATPKVERTIVKKAPLKNTTDKLSKVNKPTVESRPRTKTAPNPSSPSHESKTVPVPRSVKKPVWMRRPKPAHSGVPVPEKLKRILQKQSENPDCSL